MNRITTYLAILAALIHLTACTNEDSRYVIGISQCSEDIWRNWQNSEMKIEANFHEGVALQFATALDNSQRQSHQIDSLVDNGIDLLIVAPNQLSSVSPAIDRAYDKGIPVIVFERKTDSQKYTAFVSADNYEMGRQMGAYVVSRLKGKGRVMEVKGLKGSSPADERHKGFADALAGTGVEVVTAVQGDWTEETAYEAVRACQDDLDGIDLVFGHNDRSAIGARKAFSERQKGHLPLFCGIDGLPGEHGGIQQVRDSLLEATYIYPTRGDQLLQLAIDILEGRPYQKETMLTSALVTHENAHVLLLESQEVVRQAEKLDKLQKKASGYMQQLATQRTITLLALILIALLSLVLLLFYLYYRGKVAVRRERVVNNLWNMQVSDEKQAEGPKHEEAVAGAPAAETPVSDAVNEASNTEKKAELDQETQKEDAKEPLFLVRFKDVVESKMGNSDLSVDDLAAAMNLSRVQLYRKVKAITGSSPNELLRTARLNRGYQLLVKTDKTISEVAYEVGFTAPSYFTKCFKDEFGMSPSDL